MKGKAARVRAEARAGVKVRDIARVKISMPLPLIKASPASSFLPVKGELWQRL